MNSSGKKLSFSTLILLAVYIAVTMIICEGKGSVSFWISFGFMCFAILLISGLSFLAHGRLQTIRDWVYSLPIIRWCVIYVCAEFIASLIFMFLPLGWKIPFIVQLLLVVLFGILVGPSITQRKYVENIHGETVAKTEFVRVLNAKLVALVPRAEDADLKEMLSKAVEALRHSDPMSHEDLSELEARIADLIDCLDGQIRSNDIENAKLTCKELGFSIAERSQVARAMKLSQY